MMRSLSLRAARPGGSLNVLAVPTPARPLRAGLRAGPPASTERLCRDLATIPRTSKSDNTLRYSLISVAL
jgi:hypothetical protein